MPRPILGSPHVRPTVSSTEQAVAPRAKMQDAQLQQRLRQSRSKAYVEAIKRLDAGTHHADRTALETLIEAIASEFPELGIEQRPMAIVSRCYLGPPYEVHICDFGGGIVEHFETFRSMPPLCERGRALARHSAYAFIEIYPDMMRAVGEDGSVSVIAG